MSSLYSVQPPSLTRMSADPPRSSLCLDVRSDLGANTQGLEVAIKNPKKKYQDKVSALLSGWERLASLTNGSPATVNSLAECLYRDTLTLVLKGHWPKLSPATKTHLSVTLQRCVGSLIYPSALKKCRDLIGLVNNPWGNPTLTGIFNNPEGIDDAEVLEFCLSEKESMLFVRLETLCDSKCEDLALKLARACLRCLRLSDTRFRDVCTQDELDYILDLYIFLLYKFKNVQEIINELKHLDLKEGLELIRRYSATKNVNIPPRIWKNSHKVAELAAQYFLAVAMVKPVNETVGLLKDLMTEWAMLHCRDEVISENLANMIRKLIQPAESALHVYIFIEVLVDKFGYSLKSLCIELYIRGLTMDMNELEHQKVVGDEEKVKETEVRLSFGFQKLADLLKDNIGVSRECILTAFSLYPTESSYKQIREMAVASGKIKNCSPQLILRKRKAKIPIRYREERTCKSIYRRKFIRAIESDSSSHSPATLNNCLKRCSAEVCSGTVNIQNWRTMSKTSCSSEFNSSIFFNQSGSESSGRNVRGVDDRVNLSVTNNRDITMAVSRSTSQTDMPSQRVANSCRLTPFRVDDVNFSGESTFQKDISSMVDIGSPNLRSRSGDINLLETGSNSDLTSSVDADTNKRSRSRYVNEEVILFNSSSKMKIGRTRYRSGDTSSHSSIVVSTVTYSLRKRPICAPKCLCGSCYEGVKTILSRRRSISGDYLKAKHLTRINNDESNMLHNTLRAKSVGLINKHEHKMANLVPHCKSSPINLKNSSLDSEIVEAQVRRSRSQSTHDSISSHEVIFRELKLKRAKSCSRLEDALKSKSYRKCGFSGHKNASSCNEGHNERCKANHRNDIDNCGNAVTGGNNEKTFTCNCKNCPAITAEENDLTCKVCNHPHKEFINSSNIPKLLFDSLSPKRKDALGSVSQINDSYVKTSLNYDVLSAPNEVLDAEKLGLTSQLCDDLAVVLSSPRWHMLSWVLDWSQLSSLCERYLRDRESMRNVTKELKYLNIDYNQFKDRPSAIDNKDEYCGIEKGYEQWVDISSDHSEHEYIYSSTYKKSGSTHSHEDTDSDSSVLSQRQKSNINSPDSSQSELDFKMKKVKKKPFGSFSISDSDTGTQDSRADSLGSDGCYMEKPKRKVPECRRKKIPLVKRIAEKRLNDLSKIRLIVKEDLRKSKHDPRDLASNAKEVMTIFSQVDESGKKTTSKQYCHGSHSSPSANAIPGPETRRDKDSKTLKSLRMFRPNHLKSVRDRICFSSSNESNKLKAKSNDEGIKFAPMLSTLNLNPRILLTRADVSSHYLKSKNVNPVLVKNSTLNSMQSKKSNVINTKNTQCLSEKKSIFSTSRKSTFSKSHKRVLKKLDGLGPDFELITQAVIESQLLARTVPGLNSLDMMVPPPSEPMVQVIQLPHNPPSSTSGSHGSSTASTPQKVTATQGVQTSTNSSPQKVTTTQGVQTSPILTSQKLTVTQGVQISSGLNQAPIGGEPGPSTISHRPEEHWQTPHVGVSASDNVSHNVPAFSSSSSQGESTFAGVVMETRYYSPTNVPGNVNSSTPVTAHIQRVGQPPIGLDGDSVLGSPSLRRLHQCPQLLSGTHIPIVKGVSLDIVANFRAEALRNADLTESFSSNLATPRGLQISGSLDAQKVQIVTKKEGKAYNLTPVSSTQTSPSDTKLKQTRIQKVDEDSQTDSVVHGTVLTAAEESSGQTFLLMEDGVSKFVGPGKKQQCLKVLKSSSSQVASLPKFQQAFGKTIYASNTPGAIDPANRAQATVIEEGVGTGCINSATNVSSEKIESISGPGSALSKGIQTTSIGGSSPSKTCTNIQSSNNSSLSDSIKASSNDVLTRSVPVLCSVQTVSSVSTQSENPAVGSCSTSSSNFPASPATSGQAVSHNSVNSESSSVAQKIPVVTSSQVVGTLCEVNQTNQQQPIAIPMKLSMVSLTTNLSEKELTLRNKMTELLNRALQRNVTSVNSCSTGVSTSSNITAVIQEKSQEGYASSSSDDTGSDSIESSNEQEESRITNSENVSCIIQAPRVSRPLIEIAVEENAVSPVSNHAVALQGALRSQHSVTGHVPSVLCNASSNTSVVTSQVSQSVDAANSLIPHNTMHPTVSSTTLEQLREFESVLEQVTNTSQMKERKSVLPQTESETANDLTQQLLLSQTSTPSNSTDFDSSNTPSTSFSRESFPSSPPTTPPKGGSASFSNQTTPIQANASSTRISSTTPVVVVTSYSQPIASPALSVTSQSSSSPNVTPASTPGKTPPKSSPKNTKSKSMKTTPTTTSKTTPVTKPQQKPQEDEETAQRIYAILDQYAEQLKNSPDLINKPAPRRRSNPPINPIGSSKRKKSTPTKLRLSGHPPVLTESSPGADDPRTAGSEDSSSGITQLPQVHDSPVTIPSNSDDTLRSTPTHESSPTFQLRRATNIESCESREPNRSSRSSTETSNTQTQPTDSSSQESTTVGTVPVATPTPSSSGTVVAGKSLVVGSATALPLYVPGGVRQVLFPVTSGLTASMQGRPVVVTKGSKVIRVHQVTVAGGSPMLAGAVAGAKPLQVTTGATAVQGALVVRQMCVNKSAVSSPSASAPQVSPLTMVGTTNAVKQLKLPVMQAVAGGISSQTLAGVTAQPPVVLPPGSHPLTAASILPNFSSAQGAPSADDSKETVGTPVCDNNLIISTSLDMIQPNPNSSQEQTAEPVVTSTVPALHSKPEVAVEASSLSNCECVSPKSSSGAKTSSVGCETDPHSEVSQPVTSRNSLPSISGLGCANSSAIELDTRKLVTNVSPVNKYDDVNVVTLLESSSVQTVVETSTVNSSVNIINPHFEESVLVDNVSGKVPQRNVKDEALSVLQCIDTISPGKGGMIGVVSNTFLENVDTCPISNTEQNLLVGSSVIQTGSSNGAENTTEVCSSLPPSANTIPGNVMDCNRGVPNNQCSITSSAGPPCSSFLPKDNLDRLRVQQTSESPIAYHRDEKKAEHPLEEELPKSLPQDKSDDMSINMKEDLPTTQPKSIDETSSLEGSSIDGGKSLVLDTVSVPPKIPKTSVTSADDITKVISTEAKSCEERSSEDEMEKRLARTFTGANSSDYCFPLKRASSDSKTADSPWRYVPVVKRVSVSQGKAVPVESALMRAHVESEACLSLPRITDSLPDELKGGESDDGCRSNFPTSIGTAHTSVKRRLFSDEVLEYSSYPSSKKPEKMKQRVEKLNRVPDAIEREFRQTRLELEKELRLQKSLSEECEDLGVDEPSTSDLFPEADLLLDPNPSPSYDQTMPDTSCAQTVDSSEPFSSSDFRSVDSSSSAEGVHDTAGCSKSLNISGSKSIQRKEKPLPARPRKYLLRHRGDKKKWISVRNHHGSLEYRKASKDDEKRKPLLPRPPRVSPGDVGTGSLNGSNALSQSNMAISTFTSSSGEDSLSQHPIEGTTHTTTPTFSSDVTYSPPQDDAVASPNSHTSQILETQTTPSAAQKFNITYGKKGQSYSKEYCRRGSKRSRVCRFLNYLCEQGDSRDTCDSWDSSNSIEKESTSESSKCGRTYHGMKDIGSPSTSPEEDDDGKSIPDYQEPASNHTSFTNLLQISNPSKLTKDNIEESVLEGMEDDNAILPSSNGIECDDDKGTQKKNALGKSSLRKHVIEKNAKKHILDKIDLYPRVCLKKWKGKDSITCSRYALELENVSAVPTGSKHFSCVERPLLESESSVSSDPSSENSSKTSIEQNIAVGHLELSKSLVLGKDGEFNIQSDCPNQSSVLKSSRRSSLRGHVKKGCPCCNGSPEPKKSRIFKGEKISKKVHSSKPCSKLHITKKR